MWRHRSIAWRAAAALVASSVSAAAQTQGGFTLDVSFTAAAKTFRPGDYTAVCQLHAEATGVSAGGTPAPVYDDEADNTVTVALPASVAQNCKVKLRYSWGDLPSGAVATLYYSLTLTPAGSTQPSRIVAQHFASAPIQTGVGQHFDFSLTL